VRNLGMRRSRRAVALFSALLLIVVACTSEDSSDEPIKVGVLIQLTGPAGVFGPPSQEAAELAIEEINAAGGAAGRQLELFIADDATDAQVAQEQARKLLNEDGVDVLISTESSAARESVLPVVEEAGKPMLYTPLYEGGACNDLLFNLGEVPDQQVEPVIPYIQTTYGGDTWFIVGDDYNWPRSLGEVAGRVIPEAGGTVVGEQYVPLGTSDFGTIINDIQSSEADLVMMTLVGSDAISFVQQLNEFGLGEDVRVFGLAMLDNILPALGDVEPVIASFGYFETLDTASNNEFLAALDAKFGNDRSQQTSLSESTYMAIHLYAQAVEQAGTTETEAVLDALEGQTFDAPRGSVTIDGSSRHVAQHIYVAESTADGNFSVLEDFGTIDPGSQCSS